MKTKNKVLAMVEIAVVLCSVFLMATLPAIAAEQTSQVVSATASTITTASEDDYVLDIYGNANEDDTIDMRDLTYVKLIFFGKKPETELADAKYDGEINPLDFIQIKLIIVGKEKELTVIDSENRIVTINKPMERLVLISCYAPEIVRSLNAVDKLVGMNGDYMAGSPSFFGGLCDLPNVGTGSSPDYEALLSLEPDLVIMYSGSGYASTVDMLESLSIKFIRLDCGEYYFKSKAEEGLDKDYVEEVRKLGYILDSRTDAEEYTDWYEECMNKIKSRTKGLSEGDKPRVYSGSAGKYFYYTCGGDTGYQNRFEIIGARNIAADLSGSVLVDPEWLVEQNPAIIFQAWKLPGGGMWGCYETDAMTEIIAQREALLNRPELANVDAVKNGKVYLSSCVHYGGAHIVGLAYMAKWCHPDLFEDLDPQTIHQEYLDRFQRIDYDLDEHGVFVYPKEPVS